MAHAAATPNDSHAPIARAFLRSGIHVMLGFDGGARGMLWVSQVAPGNESELAIRVYGDRGGLEWRQSDPNVLMHAEVNRPRVLVTRGSPAAGEAAARVTRVPAGHPEGYLEAFATLYSEIAQAIRAAQDNERPPEGVCYPDAEDGLDGVSFVDGVLRSNAAGSTWVPFDSPSSRD